MINGDIYKAFRKAHTDTLNSNFMPEGSSFALQKLHFAFVKVEVLQITRPRTVKEREHVSEKQGQKYIKINELALFAVC